MFDLAKWVIVTIAVFGLVFNTGVVWGFMRNDVKHIKKSIEDIWKEINKIKDILIERNKE